MLAVRICQERKRRIQSCENVILNSKYNGRRGLAIVSYARFVIGGRWLEAEQFLQAPQDPESRSLWLHYCNTFKILFRIK